MQGVMKSAIHASCYACAIYVAIIVLTLLEVRIPTSLQQYYLKQLLVSFSHAGAHKESL